jgi:hypothetical protein
MPDLLAVRGDTNIYNLTVMRADKEVNITGGKVWLTAKRELDDGDSEAVIAVDSDQGDVIFTNPLKGKAQINIPPESTMNLDEDEAFHYDVQLREANGVVTTIATGKLELIPDITRAIL